MIKTRHQIHEYSNGISTYYFAEPYNLVLRLGLRLNDISIFEKSACLILDENGVKTHSRYSGVRNLMGLENELKRIKQH